jgi:hypothetical protein
MVVIERLVGLDVHQHAVMVAASDALQAVVLSPRKMSLERFALSRARAVDSPGSGGRGGDGQRVDAV